MNDLVRSADLLRSRVGAFFTNTYGIRVATICGVCRGPGSPDGGICLQCAGHRNALGGLTCDHTVIFTYAQGHLPTKHQSVHTVRAYKWGPPAQRCVEDMRMAVAVGTGVHARCIHEYVGHAWGSVTYVPSSRGRMGLHPVAALARSVAPVSDPAGGIVRFLLEPSTTDQAQALIDSRAPGAARFTVADRYRSAVEGRHVLVVDDTWTSGSSIQSAAAVVKLAGAASVTGLCVARWLSARYSDQLALMKTLTRQYEPGHCPISGDLCRPGSQVIGEH